MKTKISILMSAAALVLAALACTIHVGGPDIPEETIPVSTESVAGLEEQVKLAKDAAEQSGVLSLQITEAQLTSYLAFKLQEEPEPFLREPQVFLRDGQVQLYGRAYQGNFTANVALIMRVGVDEAGKPTLEIVSADFGPLPVPEGLRETATAALQEAYTGALGPVATGLRLESISIADGIMTLNGRTK